MSDVRLTGLTSGGGCGCKIAPAALAEILAKVPRPFLDPALLVGIETSDDAAVYRLNDEQAVVATTDFFMPIVDNPFDFGRIAATNALSDIYAMGARPIFALAIVGMPLDKLPVNVIQDILAGGTSVCEAAGIPIAGGHSIDSVEPIYGLVALGVIHPQRVIRNSTARSGDAIVLGKAPGATGQVTAMTYVCRTISRLGSRRSCAIRRRAADCWSPVRRRRSPRCWHCFATRDSPAPR